MTSRRSVIGLIGALVLAGAATTARAEPVEIQFWHAMGGQLGDTVAKLADAFNKSQSDYKLNAVYKGSYTETLTGAIAAFRAKQHPHIVQVFEVGTATMMAAKGAVYPVYQLMADAGEPFDPKAYVPAVYGYYSTTDGKLLSMPFNSSAPVLYYNKDAFKKAGLDPNTPPKTWPEMEQYSRKLLAAGYSCGFTSGWPSWIQIENFGAWHDIPFATAENGFGGTDIKLEINDPLRIRHIENLGKWSKEKIFVYAGRENKPNPKFSTGECPMLFGSAGLAGGFTDAMKDTQFGIAMMPFYPDARKEPQNAIIGGATLWVLSGKSKAEYKGVAKFFTFLSRPEIQAKWHMETGYVPITMAAYELTRQQGFYQKFPGRDVVVEELSLHQPTKNSRGLRIGNFVQLRDVIDEELEGVWAGEKTAKQALDAAVERGNKLLADFARANR
jgi:sn-glycerol 3-phosphate transport system substrate-binding protein